MSANTESIYILPGGSTVLPSTEIGYGTGTGITSKADFTYDVSRETFNVGFKGIGLLNAFLDGSGYPVAYLGDVADNYNNTYLAVTDQASTVEAFGNTDGSFTYGRMMSLDGQNIYYAIGDVDDLYGGMVYGITRSKFAVIEGTNYFMDLDVAINLYRLGDISGTNNSSYINIDDGKEETDIYVGGSVVGGFSNSGSISAGIGDVNDDVNGTYIAVDDGAQLTQITNVPQYATDADAITAGLSTGNVYSYTDAISGRTQLCIVP